MPQANASGENTTGISNKMQVGGEVEALDRNGGEDSRWRNRARAKPTTYDKRRGRRLMYRARID